MTEKNASGGRDFGPQEAMVQKVNTLSQISLFPSFNISFSISFLNLFCQKQKNETRTVPRVVTADYCAFSLRRLLC